jgi:simple sugar transport system substrate-binding protein/ribose transport system substrate-binding protein
MTAAVVAGLALPAAAQEMTVAGIVFQQDQFFRTIQMGMEKAAADAGVEFLSGSSESLPDKEIGLIDTYVARGVDAIVISPISADASIPALQRAVDAGVKVVTYNSTINSDLPVSYLNSNQRDLGTSTGQLAAAFVKDRLGGSARIGTLGFKALLPEISADRVDSFIEEVSKGNTIEIVAQQDAWLADKAVQVAGDMITANPDMNIIYAANEGGTVGAVQAVRNAGKQGEIFVFGIDGTLQLMDFLADPDDVLQAVTAQQPFVMGQMAVTNAVKAAKGEPVEKTVIVPVLGLSRTDPAAAAEFRAGLEAIQ